MTERVLTPSEGLFIAMTRGMLGAGVGLLVADRLTCEQRRVAGSVLAAVGIVTTVPAAMALLRRRPRPEPSLGGPTPAAVPPRPSLHRAPAGLEGSRGL